MYLFDGSASPVVYEIINYLCDFLLNFWGQKLIKKRHDKTKTCFRQHNINHFL